MRLAHSLADTLVSPVNDSFIDVDVFSRVHHDRSQRGQVAHYADLVLEARRKRKLVDQGIIDWIIVRNRMSSTPIEQCQADRGELVAPRVRAAVPSRRWFSRPRDFSRTFPDRADHARPDRRGDARLEPDEFATFPLGARSNR